MKSATSCGEIADSERLTSFCSECEGAVAQAAYSAEGGQSLGSSVTLPAEKMPYLHMMPCWVVSRNWMIVCISGLSGT